jgi:hypothetical protein
MTDMCRTNFLKFTFEIKMIVILLELCYNE